MSTGAASPAPADGNSLLRLAHQHVGEKYVLGALAPKNNPDWIGPWDCAEFASWLVFQIAAKLYGCRRDFGDPATADAYTGYWARDAKSLGQIVSLESASRTAGAFVLRIPQAGAIGHIVLSDGAGGTVEAHSSNDGVITSTLAQRRWDTGVLIAGIQYTQGAAVSVAPPQTAVYRLMMPVMSGNEVLKMQRKLKAAGFDPGTIDGEFGPHTQAAVVAFQLSSGLTPDGEVGPQTAQALGVQL